MTIDVVNRDNRYFVRIDEDGNVSEMRFVSERSARNYARVLRKRRLDADDNVIALNRNRCEDPTFPEGFGSRIVRL